MPRIQTHVHHAGLHLPQFEVLLHSCAGLSSPSASIELLLLCKQVTRARDAEKECRLLLGSLATGVVANACTMHQTINSQMHGVALGSLSTILLGHR